MSVSTCPLQPNVASVGSTSLLRIEVEQVDNENNDRWSGEFTAQCKHLFLIFFIVIVIIIIIITVIILHTLSSDIQSNP